MVLKQQKYYHGDLIVRSGDVANEMYFVSFGHASSIDRFHNTSLADFGPGSFFGEMGVIKERSTRNTDVLVTSPILVLFKLERAELQKLIVGFPEIQESIRSLNFKKTLQMSPAEMPGTRIFSMEPEVVRENLKKVALFKDAELAFLNEISLQLPVRACWPGECIVRAGEKGQSMVIILHGHVEIISPDGIQVYGELSKNSYFGEVSMFFGEARTATVRCKTAVTYLELNHEIFERTVSRYEKVKQCIYKVAQQNYQAYLDRRTLAKEIPEGKFGVEITTTRLKNVFTAK